MSAIVFHAALNVVLNDLLNAAIGEIAVRKGRALRLDLRIRPSMPGMPAKLSGVSTTNGLDCTA